MLESVKKIMIGVVASIDVVAASGAVVLMIRDVKKDYGTSMPRLIKRQNGALWCGYAALEGLLNANNISVSQGGLVKQLAEISNDFESAAIGYISDGNICDLINKNGKHSRCVITSGENFKKHFETELKIQKLFLFTCNSSTQEGEQKDLGHWVLVQYDENGKGVLVHDSLKTSDKGGFCTPTKYSIDEFLKKYQGYQQYEMISLCDGENQQKFYL